MTDKVRKELINHMMKEQKAQAERKGDTYAVSDGIRILCGTYKNNDITYQDTESLYKLVNGFTTDDSFLFTDEMYKSLKSIVKQYGKRNPAIVRIGYGKDAFYFNSRYLLDCIDWNRERYTDIYIKFNSDGFNKYGLYSVPVIIQNMDLFTLSVLCPVYYNPNSGMPCVQLA